ncbi:MAG: GerAB/ArcD/ProY family transporter, partial [Anaerobacillus sp.]
MQIVMTILLTPSSAIQEAKQDAWLSVIISIIFALITISSSLYVCSKYPELNFYKVSQQVLGKILGSTLTFILLVSFTIVLAAILRQYASFIVGTILPETPISVVIICMLIVAIYPTYHGIGVIGR